MPDRLRLGAAIAVQLLILALVPARQVLAGLGGQSITLRTEPVDPFDPFSGPFVTLAYEAERAPLLGGTSPAEGQPVWVVVARDAPAWSPVGVAVEKPPEAPDRVVLRATWRHARARIDSAGRFYLPQEKAKAVDEALRWRADGSTRPTALVELQVDGDGRVRLRRLRVGEQVFGD